MFILFYADRGVRLGLEVNKPTVEIPSVNVLLTKILHCELVPKTVQYVAQVRPGASVAPLLYHLAASGIIFTAIAVYIVGFRDDFLLGSPLRFVGAVSLWSCLFPGRFLFNGYLSLHEMPPF